MGTVRVKTYAKLNLTLFITGVKDGYHMLDSLVTSVDLYDGITVKKRRDKLVSIMMHGCGSESIPFESNNAAKAAQDFIRTYSTDGADITIYKNIPLGSGLGGSSADSAGVLNALSKLYKIDDFEGIKRIADANGSDTAYMLKGGYARLGGKGGEITRIDSKLKLNFLLLVPSAGVSTVQCFKKFDEYGDFGGSSSAAVGALVSGEKRALAQSIQNSLLKPAAELSDDVKRAFEELKEFDPLAVNMTGSGSGVYALFENAEFCEYAKSRYRGKFRSYVLKTQFPK